MNILKRNSLVVLFFPLLVACSPKVVEKIHWQSTPTTVDARATEYGEMHLHDKDAKMVYTLSNDHSTLYLCFKIVDEVIQQQVMMAGMEVWIDTTKKSREEIGIKYPIGGMPMPKPGSKALNGIPGKPGVSGLRQNFQLSETVLEVQGFRAIPNGPLPLNNKYDLDVKIDWDTIETMVYEMAIPLNHWYSGSTWPDTTMVFTLTVNINGIQVPEMGGGPPGPGGMNGPPQRGGGLPDGGGRPPGGAPGGMEQMMAMTEKHSFKMHFRLNSNGD